MPEEYRRCEGPAGREVSFCDDEFACHDCHDESASNRGRVVESSEQHINNVGTFLAGDFREQNLEVPCELFNELVAAHRCCAPAWGEKLCPEIWAHACSNRERGVESSEYDINIHLHESRALCFGSLDVVIVSEPFAGIRKNLCHSCNSFKKLILAHRCGTSAWGDENLKVLNSFGASGVKSLSGHGVPGHSGLEASVHVSCGVVNKFDVRQDELVEPKLAIEKECQTRSEKPEKLDATVIV